MFDRSGLGSFFPPAVLIAHDGRNSSSRTHRVAILAQAYQRYLACSRLRRLTESSRTLAMPVTLAPCRRDTLFEALTILVGYGRWDARSRRGNKRATIEHATSCRDEINEINEI